jgi:hypothetical protein
MYHRSRPTRAAVSQQIKVFKRIRFSANLLRQRCSLRLGFHITFKMSCEREVFRKQLKFVHVLLPLFFELIVCHPDRLFGLVVRVPGDTTEMYCVSCEIRTEFIYVM